MDGVLNTDRRANSSEIILDESTAVVIGVVSQKYVGYSNKAFLRDVLICLDEDNNGALFPDTMTSFFKVAYSINSRTLLRLVSKSVKGVISGIGGTGEDVSEIGVEVSNSMAGGHAVRLSWFVFRLICANGLVAQVAGSQGRIVHSGDKESFRKRLYASGRGLFASLGRSKHMIENLASIQFDPVGLAKHADLKMLFSIIPRIVISRKKLSNGRKARVTMCCLTVTGKSCDWLMRLQKYHFAWAVSKLFVFFVHACGMMRQCMIS